MTDTPERFALFAFNHCYPAGGTGDFRGWYPSVEAAKEAAKQLSFYDNHEVTNSSLDLVWEN